MDHPTTRRDFLAGSAAVVALPSVVGASAPAPAASVVKVVVWDERQPAQKQAYDGFLGDRIAAHLRSEPGFTVRSVGIDDPEQGLSFGVLDDAQVLVWWGHARNSEVAPEVGRRIVERIKAGTLGLVALHSAHWSTPFVEAMNERARLDALKEWGSTGDKVKLVEVPPPRRFTTPQRGDRITPYSTARKFPGGSTEVELRQPICCFPAYAHDGKPSFSKVTTPDHPIAEGLPRSFELPQTEMYDEPFHVPEPDHVVIEERWDGGEWFRSGMTWSLGKGQVVYYRPGHETYPIYKQAIPLKIVTNAARWIASRRP